MADRLGGPVPVWPAPGVRVPSDRAIRRRLSRSAAVLFVARCDPQRITGVLCARFGVHPEEVLGNRAYLMRNVPGLRAYAEKPGATSHEATAQRVKLLGCTKGSVRSGRRVGRLALAHLGLRRKTRRASARRRAHACSRAVSARSQSPPSSPHPSPRPPRSAAACGLRPPDLGASASPHDSSGVLR